MGNELNPRDVKIIKKINDMPREKGLKRAREFRKYLDDRSRNTFDTGSGFNRDTAFSKAIDLTVARLSKK